MTRQFQSISNLTITLLINCCGLASITTGWPIKSSLAVSFSAVLLLLSTKTTKQGKNFVMEGLPVVLVTLEHEVLKNAKHNCECKI